MGCSGMISDHELFAMRHPRIVEFHKFFSEYHIFFEAASERFKVSIRVFETHDGRFFFEQSHYMKTPLQESLHAGLHDSHDLPHAALSQAVESITTYYDEAIGQGHEPSATWFLRNEVY